jgi:predicted membrane channel-forming protein YqfA (hemolysin III family)
MSLSSKTHDFMLKIDLIGIGIMIFGLTLTACYIGFHNWPTERFWILVMMGTLFVGNFIIQLTPCYEREEYHFHRVAFYFSLLIVCLGLAMIGRFYLATQIEVNEFYSQLILSFVWLGVGFVFYASKWPESRYSSSWV